MSTVTSSTTSTTASTPAASSSASDPTTLGKDDFLKLMMAQLQNQDPLSPMDGSAFVAQLAQFSNVEQLQSVNDNLSQMLVAQASSNQVADASLVGKQISYKSNTMTLGSSGPATSIASLPSAAKTVTAVITDANGKVVRTLQLGAQAAGSMTISWDGRSDAGQPEPAGQYTVSVTAADSNGNAITVTDEGSGKVTGLSFEAGYPELMIGTQVVNLTDVEDINASP